MKNIILSLSAFFLISCVQPKKEIESEPTDANIETYTISEIKKFYVISNKLITAPDQFTVNIKAPKSTSAIDLFLDDNFIGKTERNSDDFEFKISLTNLKPEKHVILFKETQTQNIIAQREFILTHPYYVFVSNDWDYAPCTSQNVKNQELALHAKHKELKLTHFIGPYTFTDPIVSNVERQQCVKWINSLKDNYGDEIGLHIHPYCNFVQAAGLKCRTTPNFNAPLGRENLDPDPSGYAVVLNSYTYGETLTLLDKADELFIAHGLNKPTSFRAGGWASGLDTLKALSQKGYVVDASGANWARIHQYRYLYDWNRLNWPTINDLSQPY